MGHQPTERHRFSPKVRLHLWSNSLNELLTPFGHFDVLRRWQVFDACCINLATTNVTGPECFGELWGFPFMYYIHVLPK